MINRILLGIAITAGVGAGAAGVALGYSGNGPFSSTPAGSAPMSSQAAPYYLCPADGHLGRLSSGDRVYLTGIDESGVWVQLRAPGNPDDRVWVERRHVDPDRELELPTASCTSEMAEFERVDGTTTTTAPEPDDDPEEPDGDTGQPDGDAEEPPATTGSTTTSTTSTTSPSTTTSTTAPPTTTSTTSPPTTTTTTAPDNQGPSISNLGRTAGLIRTASGEFCPAGLPTSAQVSAHVTDPSNVAFVEARWSFWFGGAQRTGAVTMVPTGGGNYTGTIDLSHLGGVQTVVDINWSVRAGDGVGNISTALPSANARIELQGC